MGWVTFARSSSPLPGHFYSSEIILGPIALQNQRAVYGILFRAVSETLRTIARDKRHLGARVGFLAVLHTWGQNLMPHPHLHCVVPGGGISPDGSRWIPCRPGFFPPVRVLSRFFRRRFLSLLKDARKRGKLSFHGKLRPLSDPARWADLSAELGRAERVVYSKPPFGGPEQALKHLARHTHRVAISNHRLLSFEGGKVAFRWKDCRRGGRPRTMTLEAVEFVRRFLLHVLPKGFMRVRAYGFLANRCRKEKLGLCRRLIGCSRPAEAPDRAGGEPAADPEARPPLCPSCRLGRLLPPEILSPVASNVQERARDP